MYDPYKFEDEIPHQSMISHSKYKSNDIEIEDFGVFVEKLISFFSIFLDSAEENDPNFEEISNELLEDLSHIVKLETEQYYFWVKTRHEAVEAATAILDDYQRNIDQMVESIFQDKTRKLQQVIEDEQELVNDLWGKLHAMFVGLDDVRDLLTLVRNLHEEFASAMQQLEEYVAQIRIPTKLSDLENDLFEPITNEEIVSLF